jgi:hypothetical protein
MVGWTVPWLAEESKVEVARIPEADADDPKNKKLMKDLFADFNAQVEELKGHAAESRTTTMRHKSASSSASSKSSSRRKRRNRETKVQEQPQPQPRVVLESRISHLGRTVRFESEISLSDNASNRTQDDDSARSVFGKSKWLPRNVVRGRSRKQTDSGSVSTKASSTPSGSSSSLNTGRSSSVPISFASFKKLLNPLLGHDRGTEGGNNLLFDLKMWWKNDDADTTEGEKDEVMEPWSLGSAWGTTSREEPAVLSTSTINATFGRDKGYSVDQDFEVESPMHSALKTKGKTLVCLKLAFSRPCIMQIHISINKFTSRYMLTCHTSSHNLHISIAHTESACASSSCTSHSNL